MRIHSLLATGLLATSLLATSAPVLAAPAPPTAKAPVTAQTQAAVQDAMLYLKVIISALQSDKVEQPVKGALVGCLYNNSLGKITEAVDKLSAQNPGKVKRDDPNSMLGAVAAVCGYRPGGEGKAPAAPAPKK